MRTFFFNQIEELSRNCDLRFNSECPLGVATLIADLGTKKT